MAGLHIGKKFGTKLAGKASILGGIILIGIGLEIFLTGIFGKNVFWCPCGKTTAFSAVSLRNLGAAWQSCCVFCRFVRKFRTFSE